MNIEKVINNDTANVRICGKVDPQTAPELEKELKDCFEESNKLVLDLSELMYISSAGFRVLLAAQKVMSQKGGMKVTNVTKDIETLFEVTGFTDILTIE